jgi:uncharacterized protein YecE (DUF72 family)
VRIESFPHFHIGTIAWAYEDWRGVFYPTDLPSNRWLGWYAKGLNAVEIDSTFYAVPPAQTVGRWLGEAPAHFRFTCKAPKEITHVARLRNCEGALEDFLARMEPLQSRLGAVLFQMPPGFSPEADGLALRDFVRALPGGWRFAIEFRDAAWHQPRFVKLLEDRGVCWVWNDTSTVQAQDDGPFGLLPETADFLYVRLLGDIQRKYGADGKRLHTYQKLMWPRGMALESWAVRLQKAEQHHVYVMCANHYEGYAPESCRRLGEKLGVEIALPALVTEENANGRARQLELL